MDQEEVRGGLNIEGPKYFISINQNLLQLSAKTDYKGESI